MKTGDGIFSKLVHPQDNLSSTKGIFLYKSKSTPKSSLTVNEITSGLHIHVIPPCTSLLNSKLGLTGVYIIFLFLL